MAIMRRFKGGVTRQCEQEVEKDRVDEPVP